MPTPQEEQVNANIELLLDLQWKGMDPTARTNLTNSLNKVKSDYREAVEKAKTDTSYKGIGDSIAKSLPILVKGTYAASEAFQKGDAITGSAALVDICAGMIPLFTSLFSNTPAGTLVGALFSIVGQILSFFAAKQPSLEDKIEKMFSKQQTEEEKKNIRAVGDKIKADAAWVEAKCNGGPAWEPPVSLDGTVSLTPGSKTVTGTGTRFKQTTEVGQWLRFDSDLSRMVYKIDAIISDTNLTLSTPYDGALWPRTRVKYLVRTIHKSVADILAMPLETVEQGDNFSVAIGALTRGLQSLTNQVAEFATWTVATYLKTEENKSKEGWPEVLGYWCRAYSDMLTMEIMVNGMVDRRTMRRLLAETHVPDKKPAMRLTDDEVDKINKGPITDTIKTECNQKLKTLLSELQSLHEAWSTRNTEMKKTVGDIMGAARERGLYAHLGYKRGGLVLYVVPGNGKSDPLKWGDYKSNTAWLKRISIHVPRSQKDSLTPKYEVLVYDDSKSIRCHSLDSITGALSNADPKDPIIVPRSNPPETILDVSGIAIKAGTSGIDFSTQPETLVALIISNKNGGFVNYYTLDKNHKSTKVNIEQAVYDVDYVRCLYLPSTTLPDDPDADALADSDANPAGPPLLSQTTPLVYGALRQGRHLWVLVLNSVGHVAIPDKWESCNGVEADPYYVWLFGKHGIACATHTSIIKSLQLSRKEGKGKPPSWICHDFPSEFKMPEVKSLCPCIDGTLLVSMRDDIYTANYEIDDMQQSIRITDWRARGGQAEQVIKMPIPCWPLLQSLNERLPST